jgi:predicted O-methyltransferase YrrM
MTQDKWSAVDNYIESQLLASDPVLDDVLAANAASGLPPIDVSPMAGKFLHLAARMVGARRILEIGTLGGYSTIWLARAVPEGGEVVTLEFDPGHAAIARANIERAGLAGRVDIRVGPALDALPLLQGPFDFVFIDADKINNSRYLAWALKLTRRGAAIVCDNVVRDGAVLDAASDDPSVLGARGLFQTLQAESRLSATALQTVGCKGWDGFVLAVVN